MTQKHALVPQSTLYTLRIELVTRWIQEAWMRQRPEQDWIVIGTNNVCMDESVIVQFDMTIELDEDYRFLSAHPIQTHDYPIVYNWMYEGTLTQRSGAFVYRFAKEDGSHALDVLVVSYYINDNQQMNHMTCLPRDFMPIWASFINACHRLRRPHNRVTVIGGNQRNYEPRVDLEDIIMSDALKQEILDDVDKFFRHGVKVYQKLNLNPFRKILLAGVPGTGKTMLCNALAKWALEREYSVLYISGADARGANFFKIQQALAISGNAKSPTLIILEEIDSFLNDKQKSMILNVLDGVEGFENEWGTMLIATTNYPEAIDDRVLKRPGRLDRIYIVPPAPNEEIVIRMLQQYLGDMWQEEHAKIARRLVDYPGAFIREVCVFALTQAIDINSDTDDISVPLAVLEDSFERLKTQIKAREALVKQNPNNRKVGFASGKNGRK